PRGHGIEVDERAIFRIHERASAGRDHHVPQRLNDAQDVTFGGSEVRLALTDENLRNRLPLALLDELVDVFRLPVQAVRERARHRALSAGHESDQIDLVEHHAVSSARSRAKPGYDTVT